MLKKIKEFIHRSPIKSIPLVVLAILVMSTVNVYTCMIETDTLANKREETKIIAKEKSWGEISNILKMSNVAAQQNSKFMAKKIESDILRNYDLDQLKHEFESNKFSSDFHKILSSNLTEQNSAPSSLFPLNFYTVIGMEKGVIGIFSSESGKFPSEIKNSRVDWNTYILSNPNPEIARQAIGDVLEQRDGLIFWQNKIFGDNSIDKLKNMNLELTVKVAYQKYGLDALKNYSIVSPSYITDKGDIFQTDDHTFLTKNLNYKLIVTQSFTMYDIVKNYQQQIERPLTEANKLIDGISYLIQYAYIRTIFSSLSLFLLCLLFVNIYNTDKKNKDIKNAQ